MKRHTIIKIIVAGTLLAGFTGCLDNGGEMVQPEPQNPQKLPTIHLTFEDGQKGEGKMLEDFLARLGEQQPLQSQVISDSQLQTSDGPLEKSSPAPKNCTVDFDSYMGLSNAPNHANTFYTLAPWYYEPCGGTYNAYILPVNSSYYYLTPQDGSLRCPSGTKNFGYWSHSNCVAPFVDAATVSRVAGNGTSTDGDLGLQIYMYKGSSLVNFDLKWIRLIQGDGVVWGYREGIGWWWWGMLAGPANYYFPSTATNLQQIQIFHWDYDDQYVVDDIQITSVN